ncbi:MAG: DNA-protecting protein DprA [Betaproteobacteria bacterium AqS2]|uniref:DNA-protecting protein DprA n=1 Tax=Candidatus Amphirhobacter heronislandensis TaxID=1732024 RepID=A0A930UGB8_9GAMM|nr:DNA-protecting protein DprA [Betaproteobacteria bacterium AqS2]
MTPGEWGRFAGWLKDRGLTPEVLMVGRPREVLEGWSDRRITSDRIEALLDRGAALAVAVERWLRAGLWVMTRADGDYPNRLKRRLGVDSPAVLYGCGDRSLLDRGGLVVVGSRKVGEGDLDDARKVGIVAAGQGCNIVSGGARGVDEASMRSALENEGAAVGVLADSLLRASSGSKYRAHLREKRLALVSVVHPEAGFSAGNAMGRNKYIYCLGDAALVVHSGLEGGTWNGAVENLEKRWVPLWVKPTKDSSAGNDALAKRGAKWVGADIERLRIKDLWRDRGGLASKKADLFIPKKSPPESCGSPEEDGSPAREGGRPRARSVVALDESEASLPGSRYRVNVSGGSEAESIAAHPNAGFGREASALEKTDLFIPKSSSSESCGSPEDGSPAVERERSGAEFVVASGESGASLLGSRYRTSAPVGSDVGSAVVHSNADFGRDASALERDDISAAKESVSSRGNLPEGGRGKSGSISGGALQEAEVEPLTVRSAGNALVEADVTPTAVPSEADCDVSTGISAIEGLSSDEGLAFYELFLEKISRVCAESARTPDELAESLDVNKAQVNAWLKRAQAEGRVRCLVNPVRYEWIDMRQASLFGN